MMTLLFQPENVSVEFDGDIQHNLLVFTSKPTISIDYQGCMAINCGDNNVVKDVVFDNIRIDGKKIYDTMPGKPKWYHTSDFVPAYVGPYVENLKF